MRGPGAARRGLIACGVACGSLLVAACTGDRPELAEEPEPTTTSVEATTTTEVPSFAQVAQAHGDSIDVFAEEGASAPDQELVAADLTSVAGIPITFLVVSSGDDFVEVYLPTEPVGSIGWVRSTDVTLSRVQLRIEVDPAEHRLRVFEGDEVRLEVPAGIGPDLPAASDGLFIKELVQPPDDDGPYGAYVYGFSGAPAVRGGIAEGEGVVGIHGTDDADQIGTDMQTGSVTLAEDVLAQLVDEIGLPLGTPVEIVA